MTYKEIYYLTGLCLSLDARPDYRETIVKSILDKPVDWEGCLQLWSDHLVIQTIYLRFKAHDLLDFLPADLHQTLAEIYELNCRRNAEILQQVKRLTDLLHPENIFPVFLKGTGNLLDGLYSDPGERMIHDIDFLVSEEDYLRTASLLQAVGYCHDSPNYFDFKKLKHYPALYKTGEPTVVEIHRMPVAAQYGHEFTSRVVFRDKQKVKGLPGVYVPCDRHKLIHTFIHNQLSDRGHAYYQSSFRAFNDLLQLSKRMQVLTLPSYTMYRKQAICWLVFGQQVMGLPGRFYPFETKLARRYSVKYDLALTYTKLFQVYLFILKLNYLLFVRYSGGLVKAIFLKEQRRSAYRRLKNPSWYGTHAMSVREYF